MLRSRESIQLATHYFLLIQAQMEQECQINTIIVPQGAEYRAVCRGLQRAKAEVRVLTIPIGTKNVIEILANYSAQLDDSGRLLILGLCGSFDSAYKVGDRVLIQSCQNLDGDRLDLDRQLTLELRERLLIETVTGLTSDRVVASAQDKLRLAQNHAANVVEMEGYSYIAQLQQRGLAVAMLRVVSDDLKGNIPDLSGAIDFNGNLKVVPMAIAFLKQPIAAVRLIRGSLAGLKALEQIVSQLFSS